MEAGHGQLEAKPRAAWGAEELGKVLCHRVDAGFQGDPAPQVGRQGGHLLRPRYHHLSRLGEEGQAGVPAAGQVQADILLGQGLPRHGHLLCDLPLQLGEGGFRETKVEGEPQQGGLPQTA
ncbi:MAG: hypothetical protein WCK63_16655 [Betaproteobacteria bacterium]